ncbi:acyl-coenzyme A thioesterase 13-like isoform X1 [Aphis gossypii]|uniref:acyl-coenzyme A thioesterase 13-like isoform X1 n=1 Tax=Aphis gossypii TaxID=80765 RepID=UPI00215972B5|nr:acyl-coenzyme A thioesterase 13-like isoform X1 [Aphis gossypii]
MCSNKVLDSVRKILNYSIKRGGHDRVLDKVDLISAGNGQLIAEMVVEKQHTNVLGTLHGGFTATAVDVLSSMAVLTHPRVVEDIDSAPNSGVSVDIHVSYLNSAKVGDRIVIDSETVKLGRNLAFLKVTLFRKDDNVILARGSHTKFVG